MMKRFALIAISVTIMLGFLNMTCKVVPLIKANFVEGVITQDTIWTLIDSPFILTNNVTVNTSATLTIEPGVEVRFGGGFWLIVNGRILADGTVEKKIRFTANDPTHNITWQTISLNGPQSSSFTYCIIEYGTNGITQDDGSLVIQDSYIDHNSESGVTINKGSLTISNSEITQNGAAALNIQGGSPVSIENNIINSSEIGICIAAGDQVGIRSNVITSAGDGLVLTGNLMGAIDIRQNEISECRQSGMLLKQDISVNTVITENNITSNNYGFFVSANTSTNIVRNYVSNNTVGMYYTGNTIHQVYFNDIYENGLGAELDSSTNVVVNAAHNFWGDRSGPKHFALNPYGKGNRVDSVGANLTIIPFLTHPFSYNNLPPTAVLWTDKVLVAPYQSVTFIGTDSQDDGNVERYFFDFNDTTDSGWAALSLFDHSYSTPGNYVASLTVEDDFGSISSAATATVDVADLPPLGASIALTNSTVAYNGEVWVTVYVSAGGFGVANANIGLFSVHGGSFESQSGLTDTNGVFGTKFRAPNVAAATDVRIIARASMDGYADGSDYKYVRVLPPLRVQVTPEPATIRSEEATTLSVRVTNDLDEALAGASLTLSCSNGTLSDYAGITDSNGSATFTLRAPVTLDQIDITVTAKANKTGYVDGYDEADITVEPKRLALEVIANPATIVTEETTTITASVTFDSTPIWNAIVIASSDIGGNFSTTIQLTDIVGVARFAFTAPQIFTNYEINATITVTAFKSAYVAAESHTLVTIKPKEMTVQILPNSTTTYSGGRLNVTVHVEDSKGFMQDANVTITAANGSFTPTTGITDNSGNVTFTFTAPEISEALNVTISATAQKAGYFDNGNILEILINLRTFSIQTTPTTIKSGQPEAVTIHVTCYEDGTSVSDATVTMSYEGGSPVTNTTDSTGACKFVVNTPDTSADYLNMTLTVAKNGYQQWTVNLLLTIAPQEGGFPWITMLLIAVPVIIAVLVVVLIKTKMLVVSTKEET